MAGTLEFAIHTLVEDRLDMSVFDQKYNNDDIGCAAYDQKVLLKVVLFAYARGLISSRKIERACKENITFIALSCGQHFDHSTIATPARRGKVLCGAVRLSISQRTLRPKKQVNSDDEQQS